MSRPNDARAGSLLGLLPLGLLLLLPGCPPTTDDDDSAGTDLTDDDDATGDDDDAVDDDDSSGLDYARATTPSFADCEHAQGEFMLMLGDTTLVGPFAGIAPAPDSWSDDGSTAWSMTLGTAMTSVQLGGDRDGYAVGSSILWTPSPAGTGELVATITVGADDLGGAPSILAGDYALVTNADQSVNGETTFETLPTPDQSTRGTFSGVLQHVVQAGLGNVQTVGVTGCFETTLAPPP